MDSTTIARLAATRPPNALRYTMRGAQERYEFLSKKIGPLPPLPGNIIAVNAQLAIYDTMLAGEQEEVIHFRCPPPPKQSQPSAATPSTPPASKVAAVVAPPKAAKPTSAKAEFGLDRALAAHHFDADQSVAQHTALSIVPGFTKTETLAKIASAVLPAKYHSLERLSEPERRATLARGFYQAHLTYPGCQTEFAALAAAGVWRPTLDGMDRAIAAQQQKKIAAMLRSK